MIDVFINGVSLYKTYGLILTDLDEPLPTPQLHTVEIDGGSGYLDLTEEPPTYNSRTVKLQFATQDTTEATRRAITKLIGSRVKVYIDGHYGYYEGRINQADYTHDGTIRRVTISLHAQPYQYAKEETTINQPLTAEEKEIVIENDDMPIEPMIEASEKATIIIEEGAKRTEYTLSKGISYPFILGSGSHAIKAKGSGNLKITYRKGRL